MAHNTTKRTTPIPLLDRTDVQAAISAFELAAARYEADLFGDERRRHDSSLEGAVYDARDELYNICPEYLAEWIIDRAAQMQATGYDEEDNDDLRLVCREDPDREMTWHEWLWLTGTSWDIPDECECDAESLFIRSYIRAGMFLRHMLLCANCSDQYFLTREDQPV